MNHKQRTSQSGSTLVFFVVIIAVATSLIFAAVKQVRAVDRHTVNSYQSTRAYYLAESGIDWASKHAIELGQKVKYQLTETDQFEVELITENYGLYIRSIGYAGSATCILKRKIPRK